MDKKRALALAKLMIAVAWADGDLERNEVGQVKDLIHKHFTVEQFIDEDWRQIEWYLVGRVGPGERGRLLREVLAQTSSQHDVDECWKLVEAVVAADGVQHEAEKAVLDEIRRAIENHKPRGFFGRLFGGGQPDGGPNREHRVKDFADHELYFAVYSDYEADGLLPSESEAVLKTAAAAAGLLTRIGLSDRDFAPEEAIAAARVLHQHWQVSENCAERLVRVAGLRGPLIDAFKCANHLRQATNEAQRSELLSHCFTVAASSDGVDDDELDRIRRTAGDLNLDPAAMVAARRAAGVARPQ